VQARNFEIVVIVMAVEVVVAAAVIIWYPYITKDDAAILI
jgi:hypothetical protein